MRDLRAHRSGIGSPHHFPVGPFLFSVVKKILIQRLLLEREEERKEGERKGEKGKGRKEEKQPKKKNVIMAFPFATAGGNHSSFVFSSVSARR